MGRIRSILTDRPSDDKERGHTTVRPSDIIRDYRSERPAQSYIIRSIFFGALLSLLLQEAAAMNEAPEQNPDLNAFSLALRKEADAKAAARRRPMDAVASGKKSADDVSAPPPRTSRESQHNVKNFKVGDEVWVKRN